MRPRCVPARRRTVGIDQKAAQFLDGWLEVRRIRVPGGGPVFCALKGQPVAPSYVRTMLHRLAAKTGIEKRVHPHGQRHTHAYELMMEGVPVPIIQQQLGRASLATTDRYLRHIAPKDLIATIRDREWDLGND